jgi:hypothetical protein
MANESPRPWIRTHLLTFTPEQGDAAKSWIVMLSETARASGWRSAHTQAEWDNRLAASWTVDHQGCWKHWGRSTPQGEPGSISVHAST